MKDDRLYLIHIRECIERIESYTIEGRSFFLADTKTQDAVLRNLQTLAESTQRISSSLKANHPEVDWRSIAAFRNVAVHNYLGIDLKQCEGALRRFCRAAKNLLLFTADILFKDSVKGAIILCTTQS